MNDKKLCPFRKMKRNVYDEHFPSKFNGVKEEFEVCEKDSCMAYDDFGMYGKCKLTEIKTK